MAKLGTLLRLLLLLVVLPRICQVNKQDKIGVLAVLVDQRSPYLHPLEILPSSFISILLSHESATV